MTYKQSITAAMDELAKDRDVCFIGYGITHGRAMGTLANVPREQLIETPVAENLMVGLATGLALRGRKPVVFFERFDFVLNALDAIINHQIKTALMSRGAFASPVIYRIIVGNTSKPLFTGETHTQNFTGALCQLAGSADQFSVTEINEQNGNGSRVSWLYSGALEMLEMGHTTAFVEYKDLY